MTTTIIAIVILIVLIVWFKAYRRKKEYKIPTYYNTPTNYADLDANQVVRKRSKEYVPFSVRNGYQTMDDYNNKTFYENISNDVPNYNEPDNTGFSGGFGGGEFSGGGVGESWSDNNTND